MVYFCYIILVLGFILEVSCFEMMNKIGPSVRKRKYLSNVCFIRDNIGDNHGLLRLFAVYKFALLLQLIIAFIGFFCFEAIFNYVFLLWGVRCIYCTIIILFVPADRM